MGKYKRVGLAVAERLARPSTDRGDEGSTLGVVGDFFDLANDMSAVANDTSAVAHVAWVLMATVELLMATVARVLVATIARKKLLHDDRHP